MARILLIEDDAELGAQIVATLRRAGYDPTWWRTGRHVDPSTLAGLALVILDLMLPDTYGMDILKELRSASEVPVLVLSARNDTADKVRALKLGADDYMTKPFWPEELIERVRARLRRPVLSRVIERVELGRLGLDVATRAAVVDGTPVELTRVEFELLVALARRPGIAVTRTWLAEHVLPPGRDGTERTLDVHVSRLRKKLGSGVRIETVWGIGYRLSTEGT
ncbi:MAG TPA: response regulator transcription factor [Kofleriaceae bacterium]|nr:response regulator transcription factor [Kofleriaceae bacterium]